MFSYITIMDIFPLILFAIAIYMTIMYVEMVMFHVRYTGKIKRGIPIFWEHLPDDIHFFLTNLPRDIYHQKTGAFIRKQGNQVLIQYYPINKSILTSIKGGGTMLYVAYIDLNSVNPKIQYRVAVTPLLLFITIAVAILWIIIWDLQVIQDMAICFGIGIVVFTLIHLAQRKKIFDFYPAGNENLVLRIIMLRLDSDINPSVEGLSMRFPNPIYHKRTHNQPILGTMIVQVHTPAACRRHDADQSTSFITIQCRRHLC